MGIPHLMGIPHQPMSLIGPSGRGKARGRHVPSEGEMLRTPNFGRNSLNEIKEVLAQMGSISAWKCRAGRLRTSTNSPSGSRTPITRVLR
jgi:Bacterial RNA polymerase, alpha chain C terminal domain